MLHLQHIASQGPALEAAISLFKVYAQELQADLCFQSFDDELANPLKKYGPPTGTLWLAYYHEQPVGCIALQALNANDCEMKRLYVQPAFRKLKIAQALVQQLLYDAKELGFTTMKLDTLQRLQPAIQLYKHFGFTETSAYYENPLNEVVYMEKQL